MSKAFRNCFRQMGTVFHGLLFVAIASSSVMAEVIAVPMGGDGSSLTQTMFWESLNAKATLLLIPGGDGKVNLKPTQTDMKNNFYQALKALTQGANGFEGVNVVIFDSPQSLDPAPRAYPVSRATKDHLARIASVVRFYKQKTGTPIWLMGHSNGGISVTEFSRFDDPEGGPALLSGLVLSEARNGSRFNEKIPSIPVLFLHHEKDGCSDATASSSLRNFEELKQANKAPTEFKYITGGETQGNPCASGHHMYYGSEMQMDDALRDFIFSHTP